MHYETDKIRGRNALHTQNNGIVLKTELGIVYAKILPPEMALFKTGKVKT